jgi:hypothetical protein
MLDIINTKISGLCTLDYEEETKRIFGRTTHFIALYRTDFPEGARTELVRYFGEKYDDVEADVVEYLFNIIIREEYKSWKNYDLVK